MDANPKTERPRPRALAEGQSFRPAGMPGETVVRKGELALVIKVSVRTVERMMAAEQIRPLSGFGRLVRFSLSDVMECLRNGNRKFGRHAALPCPTLTGNPKAEGRNPKEVRTPKSEIRSARREA